MIRRLIAHALCLASVGCSTLYLHTDGFGSKLQTPCRTREACKGLETEAENRVTRCKDNEIGSVKCSDANADLHTVRSWIGEFDRQDQEVASAKREAQRKEQLKIDEVKEAAERTRSREKEASEAAQRAVAEWERKAPLACSEANDVAICDDTSATVDMADRALCKTRCGERIQKRRADIYAGALSVCTDAFAAARGSVAAKCQFLTSSGAPADAAGKWDMSARQKECNDECRGDGVRILAQDAPPPQRKPAARRDPVIVNISTSSVAEPGPKSSAR